MHFVAMLVEVEPSESVSPSGLQEAIYAHAMVMNLISSVDAELGKMLHDMQRNKRFTIAILKNRKTGYLLRLTFFSKGCIGLTQMFIQQLSEDPTIRLGRSVWNVNNVYFTGSPWAGTATWNDITTADLGYRIRFDFSTPTAFAKTNSRKMRFFDLVPNPETLFTSLARRWQSLGAPDLPADFDEYLRSGGCVVSEHNLRTKRAELSERTQIGFLGNVIFECLNHERAYVAAINHLSRLAFYTGVGYQTTRGMGAVRIKVLDSNRVDQ